MRNWQKRRGAAKGIIKRMKINIGVLRIFLVTSTPLSIDETPNPNTPSTGDRGTKDEQTTLSRFFLINRTYNKRRRNGTVFNEDDYSGQSSGQRIIRRTQGKGFNKFSNYCRSISSFPLNWDAGNGQDGSGDLGSNGRDCHSHVLRDLQRLLTPLCFSLSLFLSFARFLGFTASS